MHFSSSFFLEIARSLFEKSFFGDAVNSLGMPSVVLRGVKKRFMETEAWAISSMSIWSDPCYSQDETQIILTL